MNIDLEPIIKEFPNHPPTEEQLKKILPKLGLSIGLAALILTSLKILRDIQKENAEKIESERYKVVCCQIIDHKKCGGKIVHTEIKEEGNSKFLVLICKNKHITKKLLPKEY